MATPHLTRPATSLSRGDDALDWVFESVLFERSGQSARIDALVEPDFFADLNLDQVVETLTAGRDEYALRCFFHAPLGDESAVRYRHEVMRDLETPDVAEAIAAFCDAMKVVRKHLGRVEKLRYPPQKQAWFLGAVEIYCDAVSNLAAGLGELNLGSRGLRGLRGFLAAYVASDRFTALAAETNALESALAGVEYAVRIYGARVTVSRYGGEPDYSAEVEGIFARFRQGAVRSYLVQLSDVVEMNHVEEQILDRVARLYPEVFGELADFFRRSGDCFDKTTLRFDREIQVLRAYLEVMNRLRGAGFAFSYPDVSNVSKELAVQDAFDLALAIKLVGEGGRVVGNDVSLAGPERVLVVSGPNNGGKTTFARMVGQLHYLAALGLPVPGRQARLFLTDRVFAHFEQEEDIETLRGKFEDELVRVREILEQATGDSLIVMNESFNSTSLQDALTVGTDVVHRILDLGCLAVYVTFIEELASLSDATVSMVSEVVPANPAKRTFKVVRRPADGLAYAWAIAEKYGLTYAGLMKRIEG